MYLFEGPALYENVKGLLKIAVDDAVFEYSSGGDSFKLEFLTDPTNRTFRLFTALWSLPSLITPSYVI